MHPIKPALLCAALASFLALTSVSPVSALPLGTAAGGATLQADTGEPVIEVRSRGGAVAAGILGGLVLGGIIASQARPYPYYGYPAYPYPAYGPYPAGSGAIAYCTRKYKSFDPYSMTYLGYDGRRHPCP